MTNVKENLTALEKDFEKISINFMEALIKCQNKDVFENSAACGMLAQVAIPLAENISFLKEVSKLDNEHYENIKDMDNQKKAEYFFDLSIKEREKEMKGEDK